VERRAGGRQIPKGKDRAKKNLREFRERINKEEKTCGSATRQNAGSGAEGCWKPSKEGSN
jgi:hypothetical protein